MGDIMDVGFIGLGNMGAEMARNLLKAGHLTPGRSLIEHIPLHTVRGP
jgi:3-hydroxyisobutyrate dehydrogenase-like beta-hydroxyacid dehydrogenase